MSGHETVDQLRTIAKEEQQERSRRIMHSVSIVVESAHDDCDALPTALHQAATNDSDFAQELTRDTDPETGRHLPRKERHQSSPMILLDDHLADDGRVETGDKQSVQSIIATARLRKEAFARLLEEHAQLVDEINRAETSRV